MPAAAFRGPPQRASGHRPPRGGCLRLPARSPAWRASCGAILSNYVSRIAARSSHGCNCDFSCSRAGLAIPTASIVIP
eukprot:6455526-Prymnesium_polylepis.1